MNGSKYDMSELMERKHTIENHIKELMGIKKTFHPKVLISTIDYWNEKLNTINHKINKITNEKKKQNKTENRSDPFAIFDCEPT